MKDEKKEIEEIKLIIAENMATFSKAKMPYEEALNFCALGIMASGYRKGDEYEAEIERLNRRIAELEQDLVHADENVFYREQNVKLCEEKLKSEARNEDEETKKLENGIIEIFIEMCGDEPPCNFNDYGDYMILNCGDYCDTNHDKHDYRKCWEIFIKSKLREYGVDVEE